MAVHTMAIFITAREAIQARTGSGLLPAKPAELTPSDLATEQQYQDVVHNNKPTAGRHVKLTILRHL
jgi:hypothetical protein